MNVEQAARTLGISREAVRKRLKRGTLEGMKDDKGIWHVYIQAQDKKQDAGQGTGQGDHIQSLKSEVDYLRKECERKDSIIMSLTNRIPMLETRKKEKGSIFRLFKKKD